MKKALVVGGNSGVGLSLTLRLIDEGYKHVYIVGKESPNITDISPSKIDSFQERTSFRKINLINQEYSIFEEIQDIDTLIITAGFGRVSFFEELTESEVNNLIKCNMLSIIQIVKKYYSKIKSKKNFYCVIMGSISGHVASPLFSVYGASKFGLCSFIENINAELAYEGYQNRILDVSPGALKGTNFNGGGNNLSSLSCVTEEIIANMYSKKTLYIPQYNDTYKQVIQRYQSNPQEFALESCAYKIQNGRISGKPQTIIGYLSGTFDLFHIGHLNLLKRAKEQCDYLVVGVHKSGAWKGKETYIPFNERIKIVESIKYVDKAIESFAEDSDAYDVLHFDKLFVGSDYKGSERFNRYEAYFKDKGVEIVYFPYTKGTSSTQLRAALSK